MKLKNITVQIGGFHDHWLRNGSENPTLLMAGMQYYNYDFICILDRPFGEMAEWEKQVIESWMPGKKVFLGIELPYDWGHVVAVENNCKDYDLASLDWKTELKKIHSGGGFVALAHIGYPDPENQVFKSAELDEIIDGDYTDAVQLEKTRDWQWVEPRTKRGLPIPLVGGWDAHLLLNKCDDEPNLYTKSVSPAGHIDSAPGMRTIVFSEDNSLESIKSAVRAGKSVLEFVETGELFGSPELIDILISEGYPELMAKHLKEYGDLILKNEPLTAFTDATFQFPGKGTVTYPADISLNAATVETDEKGYLSLKNIPMPTMQDKNYIPLYWRGNNAERIWAVKILNNINLKVYPAIIDSKRVIMVKTLQDIECTITFESPIHVSEKVSAAAGETLYMLTLPDSAPDIILCKLAVTLPDGRVWEYEKRSGVAVAHPAETDWKDCHTYHANTQEQCGGFGDNRPYPGEDVFSGKAQFKWDKKYLYFRCDIVDAIHIPPPSGPYMYRSDCVCLSLDTKLTRSKLQSDCTGVIFGFPKEGPEIKTKKPEDIPGGAKLFLEDTEYGRIVTLHMPWEALGVDNPHKGLLMGVHFSFLNDNGTGLLDNVHWPAPAPNGKMEQPDDFGTIYLM